MKSIFRETLGDSPHIKVLDFLIENHRESWTLSEIMVNTKVGYSTLKLLLPKMLKKELVIIPKKISKANLYQINIKNGAIKHLMAFDWTLTKQSIDSLHSEIIAKLEDNINILEQRRKKINKKPKTKGGKK